MTGMKFGASRNPAMTWAMNCYAPALVCRRFRHSRIVAFSSGNVYPLVSLDSGGSKETDEPGPIGEYAITVLGRERTFQYFSDRYQIPTALAAFELCHRNALRRPGRYRPGRAGRTQPVDVSTPMFNVIWQGDANAMTLAALAHAANPPRIINIAGPEFLRVRDVAEQFGRLLNKPVRFTGQEGSTAYLNNGSRRPPAAGRRQRGRRNDDPLDRRLDPARRREPRQTDALPGAQREILSVRTTPDRANAKYGSAPLKYAFSSLA